MTSDAETPGVSSAEAIFTAALSLSADERSAYLAGICGDDQRLRQRVEALLRAHDAPEGFLPEKPAGEVPFPANITPASLTEKPGDMIGRYTIRQKIGEGGCGVVYMAEQEQPVRRKIALKIIKLGMDTKQVVARFEAERQALALMDHPNIAKVLDAGATDMGRPYFVMELVGGIKITDYCEQNQFTTRQRLELFVKVCRAIQHAHQKGVIHRDIKPSNVLVAAQDGEPVPKVIDFGIAKATQGRLTDQTVFTAFEQFLGTPAYMSPEQAQLGSFDVDTRSDIYSLGVLLYELLTRKTPFDTKELLASGLDAMRRTIQEKEPPTPSTRLKQGTSAFSAGSDKSALHTHPTLDKDLDWIAMKCLEKERARRYETANGLATDIERYLNDEPVTASPPTRLYRFQKLVRRNRITAIATVVVAVVVFLGVVASTWQAWRATRAERRSMREASKSQQVAQLLTAMLQGVEPSVAMGRDVTMLREILDKTAGRLSHDLKGQPEVEAVLRTTIGEVYLKLAALSEAESMFRQALALNKQYYGSEHVEVAISLQHVADGLAARGKLDEAEEIYRQALVMARKLRAQDATVATLLSNLAVVLGAAYGHDVVEAEKLQREALAMRRKLFGDHNPDVAESLSRLGRVLFDQEKQTEAEAANREALDILKSLYGDEHPKVSSALDALANVLHRTKPVDAEALYRAALRIDRKLLASNHPNIAISMMNLANDLGALDRLAEAESLYRDALVIFRQSLGNGHPTTLMAMGNLRTLLEDENRLAEAEALTRELLAIRRKLWPSVSAPVANEIGALAGVLCHENKMAEAEVLQKEALATYRKLYGSEHDMVALALDNLSCMLGPGRLAESETLAREALAIRQKHAAEDVHVAVSLNSLGCTLRDERKLPESEDLLRQAFLMRRKILGDGDEVTLQTLDNLVSTLELLDKRADVEALYSEHLQVLRTKLPTDDPKLGWVLRQSARALLAHNKANDAEPLARESLAIHEKKLPDDWRTFDTHSLLGGALLGQEKYHEAEPLLLNGYEGMKQRAQRIPTYCKGTLEGALQRLIRFYDTTGQTNQAARWKLQARQVANP